MALDTVTVGSNAREIVVLGDPLTASAQLSVGQFHLNDGQSLSAAFYSVLDGGVGLLKNAAGTFDVQRAAVGTTGIPAVNTESTKATYSAGVIDVTPAATATDFWQIIGSSTKTVRVLRVAISGGATAAATVDVQLVKRTALNTGGTQVSVSAIQHDSNDASATAVVNTYSANPSGTGAGQNVRAAKLNLGAAGAAGTVVFDFTTRNGKGIVLRGASQQLVLNWDGAAVPSGTSVNVDVEFSEE